MKTSGLTGAQAKEGGLTTQAGLVAYVRLRV